MSALAPVAPASRITALDALRGIALCGILLINIFDMGGPVAMDRPLGAPMLGDPDWQVWTVAQLFVTGTMRGLFSLLFGIGLLLFMGDGDDPDRLRLYFRRLLWLLLFGIVNSSLLLWPGDILVTYSLAGVVALVLHRLTPSQLLAVGGVILVLISGWAAVEAATILPVQTIYTDKMLDIEGAARLGSYHQNLVYMSYVSWTWTVNPLAWRAIGDCAAFMLIGMALYRLGLFDSDTEKGLLRRLMLIGYAVGIGLRAALVLLVWHHDGGPTFLSALIDQPGRFAMTLGHMSLFLLLWRGGARRLLGGFAPMGRMALTLYLGQSLIAAIIFSGFGFGLWNWLNWPQLWLLTLAILAGEALFAWLWFRAFRFGPMEWLWRWGTYGQRPGA